MKQLVVAVVASLISASGAFAADLAVKAPRLMSPVPEAYNWTGFYVGAAGQWHDGTILDENCEGLCEHHHHVGQAYLSIDGGFDYQLSNNVVLGAFGWLGVTPVKDISVLAPGVTVRGATDFAGFIGGRIGYAMGAFLPYAFIGVERVHGSVTVDVAPIPTNVRTHTGVGGGVGLEYRIARDWSIDGRYMYSELDRQSYDFGGGITTAAESAHTFSLGVNYRFGALAASLY
jgi:outer membrane immunogenic protein